MIMHDLLPEANILSYVRFPNSWMLQNQEQDPCSQSVRRAGGSVSDVMSSTQSVSKRSEKSISVMSLIRSPGPLHRKTCFTRRLVMNMMPNAPIATSEIVSRIMKGMVVSVVQTAVTRASESTRNLMVRLVETMEPFQL